MPLEVVGNSPDNGWPLSPPLTVERRKYWNRNIYTMRSMELESKDQNLVRKSEYPIFFSDPRNLK